MLTARMFLLTGLLYCCYPSLIIAVIPLSLTTDITHLECWQAHPPFPPLTKKRDCLLVGTLVADTPRVSGPSAAFRHGECLFLIQRVWSFATGEPELGRTAYEYRLTPPPQIRPQAAKAVFPRSVLFKAAYETAIIMGSCAHQPDGPLGGAFLAMHVRERVDVTTTYAIALMSVPAGMPDNVDKWELIDLPKIMQEGLYRPAMYNVYNTPKWPSPRSSSPGPPSSPANRMANPQSPSSPRGGGGPSSSGRDRKR